MTKLGTLLALAALLVATPLTAQKAPTDPARVAAAKELMTAMGSDAQFKVGIETMTNGMSEMVKKRQPSKAKEIDEVFALMRSKFIAKSGDVVDMVAPLWAEKFTVDELKEIGKFYKSPIGAKLIASQPEIMQKSMQLGMTWGQKIGVEVEAEAKAELKKRGIEL